VYFSIAGFSLWLLDLLSETGEITAIKSVWASAKKKPLDQLFKGLLQKYFG
jgi:hypothetical protein